MKNKLRELIANEEQSEVWFSGVSDYCIIFKYSFSYTLYYLFLFF